MFMIQQSFIFLPGMTLRKEALLWQRGINSWNDFLKAEHIPGIPEQTKQHCNLLLEEAKKRLFAEDAPYFWALLPHNQHWRLYDAFKERVCYLDIETTNNNQDITVISVFDDFDTHSLVKEKNLFRERIIELLQRFSLIITFNGATFDIPKIEKHFSLRMTTPHIDLRHVLKKIGHSGGLKDIEKELGILRREEVKVMRGHHASEAWKLWKTTGEAKFLELLLMYNEEDVVNLKQLAEYAIPKLWAKTRVYDSVNNNITQIPSPQ